MSENYGAPESLLNAFSTPTLEAMLRDMTLYDDDLEMELMDRLLAELRSRQAPDETMDPQDALKIFEEEYSGNESAYLDCAYEEPKHQTHSAETKLNRRKNLSRLLILAAAITVLLVGSLLAVNAVKEEDTGITASWTSELFGFSNKMAWLQAAEDLEDDTWPPEMPEDLPAAEDFDYADSDVLTLYESLQDLLDTYQVTSEINAPTYIPDGYELVELRRIPNGTWMEFYAYYRNDDGTGFSVSYTAYDGEPALEYEKTDDPVEEHVVQNVTTYAFSNSSSEQVVWVTEHFECSASGTISREELINIVDSIYLR